jgi:Ca2+-binding EF-hand superfamily protein
MSSSRGGMAASKVDEFRAVVRSISLDQCSSIGNVLHNALDSRGSVDPISKKKVVDCKAFQDGLLSVREIRQKFTASDMADIYTDVNEGEHAGIEIEELIDFVQRTMGKARILALKLRSSILKEYSSIDGYKKAFLNICNSNTKICDKDRFTQFAEDYLRSTISDNDSMGMYSLFDMNGDGKVSIDDFVGFMSGRSTEATTLLYGGNPEVIVDIKISNNSQQDSEYMRAGYSQVIPTEMDGDLSNKYDVNTQGSFGKGESVWIWRRKQGTCSGRLKPICDIQLGENRATSAMIVAGYTCITGNIAGMKLYVRRAVTQQDELEALVALQVSLGNSRNPSDNIWKKPSVDWLRVEANFSKHNIVGSMIFGNIDAFLWMLPQNLRRTETSGLQGLLRTAGGLSIEKRNEKVNNMAKKSIRSNVPLSQMRNICNPIDSLYFGMHLESSDNSDDHNNSYGNNMNLSSEKDSSNITTTTTTTIPTSMVRGYGFDFSHLYHDYDQTLDGKMNARKTYKLLKHSGCWLENDEVLYIFRLFDTSLGGGVSREEYANCLALSDTELDECVEKMRQKLLPSSDFGSDNNSSNNNNNNNNNNKRNESKESRILSQVFKLIDINNDGIISQHEFMTMMAALEIYVTEEEARKILSMMDIDGDDRVEENDFVTFIKNINQSNSKRAYRLRETSDILRRWLNRGAISSIEVSSTSNAISGVNNINSNSNQKQWEELQRRHELSRGTFPGFLDSDDVLNLCSYLNSHVTPLGSREIMLMIAPDQNGRVTHNDLNLFMSRTIRSFGELLALLDRDVMKPIFDLYRSLQKSIKNETNDVNKIENEYNKLIKEAIQDVQNTVVAGSSSLSSPRGGSGGAGSGDYGTDGYVHNDVVSIGQLKNGLEAAMRRYKEFDGRSPNSEEWACLVCLTGSAVAEEDIYGVSISTFMDNITKIIAGVVSEPSIESSNVSMDQLVKEIQRLIHAEALDAGNGSKLNYKAAYDIINKDGDEVLSIDEFRSNLIRLQLSHLCPEGELPKLMRLFDSNNKGYITFDDFMKFVTKYKSLNDDIVNGMGIDDFDIISDDPSQMSDIPPLAITRNADCDYLVWFIWRQCCRIEPSDPECIVTELESACTETELTVNDGSISPKELWNLLFELKIYSNNNISKNVYERGIRYLFLDTRNKSKYDGENSNNNNQIDYPALCRYVIRMGRGHTSMRDEKRANDQMEYKRLRSDLRQFLLSLNASEYSSGYTPRYAAAGNTEINDNRIKRIEKVFRRMDSDGDGKLTPSEFKSSLKRLGYKNDRLWTYSIINIFFKETDTNSDGMIDLTELSRLFTTDDNNNTNFKSSLSIKNPDDLPPRYGSKTATDNDDNDDDDGIFGGTKGSYAESELFYKTYTSLNEMVPQGDSLTPIDAISKAIRRFFHKSDSNNKGQVSEERFRAFLRRSNLLDKLTSGEIRRMLDILRRRSGSSGSSSSSSTGGGSSIDYEKLISSLKSATETGPSSRSDITLLRLREASNNSNAAGRPFYGLCSLADPNNTGRLTKDEIILAIKMMGCTITSNDLDTLKEYTTDGCFSKDGMVDYKDLNFVITNETIGNGNGNDTAGLSGISGGLLNMGPTSFSRQSNIDNRYTSQTNYGMSNATPAAYNLGIGGATPGLGTNIRTSNDKFINTYTPRDSHDWLGNTYGNTYAATPQIPSTASRSRISNNTSEGVFDERDLQVLSNRIADALEKTREKTLLQLFTLDDREKSGYVSTKVFTNVLDSIGVMLTSGDIALLQSFYPTGTGTGGYDRIDYDSFDKYINNNILGGTGTGTATFGLRDPSYINPRTLARYNDLMSDRKNPRDIFNSYDNDNTGLVDIYRFREICQRLRIFSLDAHIESACQDFASIKNKDQISYDDFCRVLELADVENQRHGSNTRGGIATGSRTINRDSRDYSVRNSYDNSGISGHGPLGGENVEKWLAYQASPKQRREFGDVYNSLSKFKSANTDRDRPKDFPNTLDDGSDYNENYYGNSNGNGNGHIDIRSSYDRDNKENGYNREREYLRPPKSILSDSKDFGSALALRTPADGGNRGGRYGSGSYTSDEWRRSSFQRGSDSPKPAATSPSKVGSKMWGSCTSLDLKGVTPKVNSGLWCCAVCLYTENETSADVCVICDSPNYTNRSEFVVKEQCKNCTFLNGQYCRDCEMCGEPLSGSGSGGKHKDNKNDSLRRSYSSGSGEQKTDKNYFSSSSRGRY